MIIKPNWDKFKEKFDDNPEYYFEYFCYLLFCIEFDKPQGIFRYKNQAGIEWNPIEVDGKIIVAQCKFYNDKLGTKKDKILEMLETIHKKYPTVNELKFYTNQDWGQGREKATNDSKPKIEIEEKAKELGITIDWRTNEKYFLSPDVAFNQEIVKHFFTDESIYDLVYDKQQHTERILDNIHTEIKFDSQIIELDRSKNIKKLKNEILKNQVLIVTGIGGVGKTAIIKKLYEQEREKGETPFYIFKASEFNLSLIDNLFGRYSLQKFIDIHDKYEEKIIVIDSSEKLLDIGTLDPFNEFLLALIQNKWKILFTTRDNYLEDLQYRFTDLGINVPTMYIKNLTQKELSLFSDNHNFILSEDIKLNQLIENPFYLNEYLRFYDKDEGLNYRKFKEKLWNNNIKNSKPKREKCFLDLALKRANKGKFYINTDCSSNSLETLLEDGILGHETAGYFITHDIYEEWALEKIIDVKFSDRKNNLKFFKKIGSSLPVRRSFRNWVSEKLSFDSKDIKSFIEEIIDDNEIKLFWKDEVFISILLSDYSDTFFEIFERELLKNDYALLKRISFLLRLACKKADNSIFQQYNLNIDMISLFTLSSQPKGNGWGSFISFVYKHIDTIKLQHINMILPIIYIWNTKYPKGETTRKASLITLEYYTLINQKEYKYDYDEYLKDICSVIIGGSFEIQSELEVIFDEILKNRWKNSSDNYYKLSEQILSNFRGVPYGLLIIKDMPTYVYKLANLFWIHTPKKIPAGVYSSFDRDEVDTAYGIEKYNLRYFPSSANQTPIYYLLKFHFIETVDFILDFVNKSVEKYAQSGWEKKFQGEDVKKVKLYIGDEIYTQYHSQSLWNIYRATSSPVSPNLLQSIHMALEKYLLDAVKVSKQDDIELLLRYLLKKSKSSSVSAIVTSIVLAYPDKTFNIARMLFQIQEFIRADFIRKFKDEFEAKSLYGIGYGVNYSHQTYQDERLKTCEEEHRNWHLESLFLNYQLFRTDEVSEEEADKRQKILWDILDNYYSELPKPDKQTVAEKSWSIALARMDRRKQDIEVERVENGVQLTFNSKLEPEIEKYSKQSQKESSETLKYNSLYLWSKNRLENNHDYKKYLEFEENALLAIEQLKEILELKEENKNPLIQDEIFSDTAIVLLRDYSQLLTTDNKEFCKNIILELAKFPLQENYNYQISDGTDSAIAKLPLLLEYFPDLKDDIKLILLLNLFRDYEIGMSGKNVHDGIIDAIVNYYNNLEIENYILGYLLLKPKYDSLYRTMRKENYRIKESEVRDNFFKEFESDIEKFIDNDLSINDIDFNIDVIPISVILKFIKFKQVNSSVIFQEVSKVFILKVFQPKEKEEKPLEKMTKFQQLDELYSKTREEFEDVDLGIKQRLFESLPHLIYKLDRAEIEQCLMPLLDNFRAREDISYLLLEFIRVHDVINQYNKFWYIWNLFENKIIEICKDGEYSYADKIIQTYLLAWSPYGAIWNEKAKEWHTLKEKDKRFFKRISQKISHCPSTLYSISKLLTGIGSSYLNDGIGWISYMVKNNKNLFTDKLEPDTVFHIENLTQKYILENSEKIKKDKVRKKEILEVLNFLVEKGSAIGYMLRERIL